MQWLNRFKPPSWPLDKDCTSIILFYLDPEDIVVLANGIPKWCKLKLSHLWLISVTCLKG